MYFLLFIVVDCYVTLTFIRNGCVTVVYFQIILISTFASFPPPYYDIKKKALAIKMSTSLGAADLVLQSLPPTVPPTCIRYPRNHPSNGVSVLQVGGGVDERPHPLTLMAVFESLQGIAAPGRGIGGGGGALDATRTLRGATGQSLAASLVTADQGCSKVFPNRAHMDASLLKYHSRCLSLSAPLETQTIGAITRFISHHKLEKSPAFSHIVSGGDDACSISAILSRHANLSFMVSGQEVCTPELGRLLSECFPASTADSVLSSSKATCDLLEFGVDGDTINPASIFVLPLPSSTSCEKATTTSSSSPVAFVVEVDTLDLTISRLWGVHFGEFEPAASGGGNSSTTPPTVEGVLTALWRSSSSSSAAAQDIRRGVQAHIDTIKISTSNNRAATSGASGESVRQVPTLSNSFVVSELKGRSGSYVLNSCTQVVDHAFGHHCCTLRSAFVINTTNGTADGKSTIAGVSHLDVYEHGSDFQSLEHKDIFRLHKAARLSTQPLISSPAEQPLSVSQAVTHWISSLEHVLLDSLPSFAGGMFDGLRLSLPISTHHLDFLSIAEISMSGAASTLAHPTTTRGGLLRELAEIKARRDTESAVSSPMLVSSS